MKSKAKPTSKNNEVGSKRRGQKFTTGKNMKGQTVHSYKRAGGKTEHVVVRAKPKKGESKGKLYKRDATGKFSK